MSKPKGTMRLPQRKVEGRLAPVTLALECGHQFKVPPTHTYAGAKIGDVIGCVDCFIESNEGLGAIREFVNRYGPKD